MVEYRWKVRVYYEDTDLGEVVYYANYLKFIERARTEMLRSLGFEQLDLKTADGLVFVVRHIEADYLKAARFDDELEVLTHPLKIGRASFELAQDIWRGDALIFRSVVKLVAVSRDLRPVKIPEDMKNAILGGVHICEAVFDHLSVVALLARHEAHCTADTDICKAHRLDLSALQSSDIRFWSLWENERAVGCIALRDLGEGRGEIKSLHVLEETRGKGYAKALLDHLIKEAQNMGMNWLGLETGDTPMFEAAYQFYLTNGFEPCAPFAEYTGDNCGRLLARDIGGSSV